MQPAPASSSGVRRRRSAAARGVETELGRTRHARRMRRLEEAFSEVWCELDFTNPLELSVATILSAQCTDKRVNQVTPALFKRYPAAADYPGADREELESCACVLQADRPPASEAGPLDFEEAAALVVGAERDHLLDLVGEA